MQFRGNTDRRRRVLMDDRSTDESPEETTAAKRTRTKKSGSNNPKHAYATEARREHQPAITDFVPQRYWTLSLLALGGLCLIAASQSLYTLVHSRLHNSPDSFHVFDLTGTSTFSAWLASLLLGISAFVSFVVYLVRRHRLDDYRARYRWWLVAGSALMIASLDASTHLHKIVPVLLTQWTGTNSTGNSSWSEYLALGVCALVALRMMIEVRRCRLAVICLLFAGLCYLGHGLAQHEALAVQSVTLAEMTAGATLLLGHLSIALGIVGYARFVCLDAHGKIKIAAPKKAKAKPAPKKATAKKASKPRVAETPKTTKKVVAKETTASTNEVVDDATDDEDEETLDFSKLSKSERRRLRKQQRRGKQAA